MYIYYIYVYKAKFKKNPSPIYVAHTYCSMTELPVASPLSKQTFSLIPTLPEDITCEELHFSIFIIISKDFNNFMSGMFLLWAGVSQNSSKSLILSYQSEVMDITAKDTYLYIAVGYRADRSETSAWFSVSAQITESLLRRCDS